MVRRRGAALLSSLAIAALLAMVALCMVAALTMNMNSVQKFSNAELAQNEAEAALSELVARVGEEPTYGSAGNETIFLQTGDRFRYLSFSNSPGGVPVIAQGLPRSTNGVNASPSGGEIAGSLGRSVPVGKVHAVATGYCRGQYATIEAMVDVPPFPYGVAVSGPLTAATAIQVEGVSSNQVARDLNPSDRPGHVASNSKHEPSVAIGTGPNGQVTHITGMVRGGAEVRVSSDAEVGALRPYASAIDLPDIDVATLKKTETGVATMNVPASQGLGDQVLDIAYYLPNDITYNGNVEMKNAYLFSEGNVTIRGSVKGKGAIIAMGDVFIGDGASLEGDNQVAVVAGGNIHIQGGGAYFSGILYAKGTVTAENLTVLGSVIANNPANPESAGAVLDRVTVKGSPEMTHLAFTVQTRGDVGSIEQTSMGRIPFEIGGGGGFPNSGTGGGMNLDVQMGTDQTMVSMQIGGQLGSLIGGTDGRSFNPNVQVAPGGAPVLAKFATAFAAAQTVDSLQHELDSLQAQLDALPPPPPPDDDDDDDDDGPSDPYAGERARLSAEISAKTAEVAAATAEFQAAANAAANAYADYVVSHTQSNGSYGGSPGQLGVSIPIDIDLNKFMHQSARVRVGYWQLYQRRF